MKFACATVLLSFYALVGCTSMAKESRVPSSEEASVNGGQAGDRTLLAKQLDASPDRVICSMEGAHKSVKYFRNSTERSVTIFHSEGDNQINDAVFTGKQIKIIQDKYLHTVMVASDINNSIKVVADGDIFGVVDPQAEDKLWKGVILFQTGNAKEKFYSSVCHNDI